LIPHPRSPTDCVQVQETEEQPRPIKELQSHDDDDDDEPKPVCEHEDIMVLWNQGVQTEKFSQIDKI
jgi:hypothetical protein